jgi:hypothetical protein
VIVAQSGPLVLLRLRFSMLRIRLDAVSGILFAIDRSDMRRVSIEIWSSDSKLLFGVSIHFHNCPLEANRSARVSPFTLTISAARAFLD